MKREAFTLAEVLITLGIIGVVTALTLPTLITNIKYAEIQASLKKNYSLIQQALLKMNEEYGYQIDGTYKWGNVGAFKRDFSKYFQIGKDCGNAFNYNQYCFHPSTNDNKKKYRTFNGSQEISEIIISSSIIDDGQFMTTDGSLYLFENAGGAGGIFISIDTNSIKKGPNKLGHDLFTFQLTNKGKLVPMGGEGTRYTDDSLYCSKDSQSSLNGVGCTAKALNDPNYFKNIFK